MTQPPPQPNVQQSYDEVAQEYTERIGDELQHKPFDRELLDGFIGHLQGEGPVADLGCGPGMVARYLHEKGVDTLGIDLSPRMITCATKLEPSVEFKAGDFTHLDDVPDNSWAGIVAFYSVVHLPRESVQPALREFYRALRPGGLLLVSFHVGSETRHASDWFGHEVDLDFVFFEVSEMLSYLWGAGFDTEYHVERPPYPEVEVQTQRGYILARKPLSAAALESAGAGELASDDAAKPTIYRIVSRSDWQAAHSAGAFRGSAHDLRDGFIHFSSAAQVPRTLAKFYAGQDDLLLLYVRTAALPDPAQLKWEPAGDGALFPHLYGPLPIEAVHHIEPLPLGADGVHQLPALDTATAPAETGPQPTSQPTAAAEPDSARERSEG